MNLSRFHTLYSEISGKYRKFAPASFFMGGVLFDVLTLGRIDQVGTIIQQALFLFCAAFILIWELRGGPAEGAHRSLFKFWEYHVEIIHFIYGGLLSAFTIFYFKSSSGLGSALFMTLLVLVLILNEFEYFKRMGEVLRWALFSICVWSYFNIIVPVFWGQIGWSVFVFSSSLAMIFLFVLLKYMKFQQEGKRRKAVFSSLAVPVLGVILYSFELIPPVPLSIQYMGIYHNVERQGGEYVLESSRQWWKFWQNGDEHFYYRDGDRVFVFARIFSPSEFNHRINLRWNFKNHLGNWEKRDLIPISVIGGRDEGFRGYAYKKNIEPGVWKVMAEAEDGREIGSIDFEIIADTDLGPREFRRERQ